jgi:scyllo-inositol 2-dehydrogenase (NADP+)
MMSVKKGRIGVGILGLGRSGYGIHAKAIHALPDKYEIKAVYDPIEDRAASTADELKVRQSKSVEDVLADKAVELVVVASTNAQHAPQAQQALRAGKHVLCEKPFGLTTADVDAMIAAAETAGKVLQPFQQRRYEQDFLKVKELCQSGLLGEIQYVRICWHGFKRRWDWQTLTSMAGGALNNNGPHPIDHAMELFGDGVPEVACEMRRVLCLGDAEDFLRITLSGPGKPTIAVELIDCAAYGYSRWWVAGSSGGLQGDADKLEWKWVDWSTMPTRQADPNPTPDRSYNSEPLDWKTDSWKAQGAADAGAGAAPAATPTLELYNDLYESIRHGKSQHVTPQSVRRRVDVMERARNAGGFYV